MQAKTDGCFTDFNGYFVNFKQAKIDVIYHNDNKDNNKTIKQ